MTRVWTTCFLLALPATGRAQPAGADAGNAPVIMDEVLVSAGYEDAAAERAPYSVERLTAGEIGERMVRTVPEALRESAGVLVQKTAHGQGSPFVRGFTGFHTLALIDGIRLNNSVYRAGPNEYWNTIDPYGIDAMELAKGQGSVRFGSEAVGGTMRAFSRGPAYAEEGTLASGHAYSRYSSAEDSYTGRLETSLSEAGRYGVFLGGTAKRFGDLKAAGLGRLATTGYGEWDADGKFELFLDDDTILTLAHQQVHQDDVWRTHRTVYSPSWEGTATGTELEHLFDQSRMLTYAQLESRPDRGEIERWTLSVSHQRADEQRRRVVSDGRVDVQGFEVDTFGLWGEAAMAAPIGNVVFGASYYADAVDSYRSDFRADGRLRRIGVQGPVADDAQYHLLSAFGEDTATLGDRAEVTVGARVTHARADAGRVADPVTGLSYSFDDAWTSAVGSARAIVRLDEGGRLAMFGGVSQAARAPNLSDLTRFDTNRSNEIETPSQGLDPERFVTVELGVRATGERFRGELSYYFTAIDDLIIRAPTGRVIDGSVEVTKRNSGSGHVQGVEAAFECAVAPAWTVFGNIAWQDSQVASFPTSLPFAVDEPLSRMLPASGLLGLRFAPAARRWWMEGLVQVAGRQDRLNAGDRLDTQRIPPGGTPGHASGILRGGVRMTEKATLFAALENVTDEEYREHGSGVNGAGRNFVFGMEMEF